jgi:hypothetical protein
VIALPLPLPLHFHCKFINYSGNLITFLCVICHQEVLQYWCLFVCVALLLLDVTVSHNGCAVVPSVVVLRIALTVPGAEVEFCCLVIA